MPIEKAPAKSPPSRPEVAAWRLALDFVTEIAL
jgi:hypothetical protein